MVVNTDVTLTIGGNEVDMALAQTHRAGLRYAIVPTPWWEDWLSFIGARGGSRFRWWETCGLPGHDFAGAHEDDDGNIAWCLLGPEHDGGCGFAPIRPQEPHEHVHVSIA